MLATSPNRAPDSGSDAYWRRFVAEHWQARPTVVPAMPFPTPSPDEMFGTLLRCSDTRRGRPAWEYFAHKARMATRGPRRRLGFDVPWRPLGASPPGTPILRFIVEGAPFLDELRDASQTVVPPWALVHPDDGDLAGYHARIVDRLNPRWYRERGLPERRYAFIVNDAEAVDVRLWKWSTDCLGAFCERVGMNNAGSFTVVFAGNYLRTSSGVHLDSDAVFHAPVIGEKVMRTWTQDYADAHPTLASAKRYDAHLHASERIAARVGEAAFWPSDRWHVGESSGDFSVSIALSMALYDHTKDLPPYARGGIADDRPVRPCLPFDRDDLVASARELPDDFVAYGRAHDHETVEDRHRNWLRCLTAMGLQTSPQGTEPRDLRDDERLVPDPEALVAWAETASGAVWLGANGHLVRLPSTRVAQAVYAAWRAGTPTRVDAVCGEGAPAEAVRTGFRHLVAQRAFRRA